MKKIIIQFAVLFALFFSTWYSLSLIDWMRVFNVKAATDKTEEKLGNIVWEAYSKSEAELDTPIIAATIDSLMGAICSSNEIDYKTIKIHVVKNSEVNAFSLPGNNMVVCTGAINAAQNQAELVGVMCHELAHIEKNHVMKKLVKEFGLSLLMTISSGKGNIGAIEQLSKLLSSTAYDRAMENEADKLAVTYMLKANVDAGGLADFLYRLSDNEKDLPSPSFWVSTHPASKERAQNIVGYIKRQREILKKNIVISGTWDAFKAASTK